MSTQTSSTNNKCVFITGISGGLGNLVAQKLCEKGGFCVKGLVKDESDKQKLSQFGCTDVCVGDLTKLQEQDFVNYLKGCDYVIDAAGATDPKDIRRVEFISGKYLATAAMKNNVKKFICMSALGCDKVGGQQTNVDWSNQLICDCVKNNRDFGINQYKLDQFIMNECQNLPYCIIRCGDLKDEPGWKKILIGKPTLGEKYKNIDCVIPREDVSCLLCDLLLDDSIKNVCFEVVGSKDQGMPIQEAIKQLKTAI
ncbi:hypothetical protein FDP41_005639 [Naegleria fowleri]|uniref:NAD(P)-binding domain-containing protein n=1 Tax=Naegleria fowleri TaxID=5763 RepID=A0A6A5BQD6_NAEFO|nr:uncharacterized protein FDP41_005639 [Naegleria fowleri]KAF0975645.1 hypothetical protein FDP41_005639 [Naegleria fowleri]CAG4719424.1 unnamed protein product [Naegleria fowleri]